MFKKLFKKAAGNTVKETIQAGTNLIDEIFTTKEEKLEAKKQLFELVIKDKDSARSMYMHDSWLQKSFALFFLAGWIVLTVIVVTWLFQATKGQNIVMPDWGIALINMIWGGLSAKLNTIVDFLFGSSAGSQQKNEKFLNKK